jgi:peroxiredoxin
LRDDPVLAERVEVLPISVDSSIDRLRSFLARKPLGFPALYSGGGDANEAFGISSVPRTIAIDREGTVRQVWLGWTGPDQTKQVLALLRELAQDDEGAR